MPGEPCGKWIFVTGGLSGLGKGVIASSVGRALSSRGLDVTIIKIDPYLNVDAGLMSPYEHGETYVQDGGTECDQDLGNYERFLNVTLTGDCSITTGKVYDSVIRKERKGEYLGATVQIVPHLTNEIKDQLRRGAGTATLAVVEVGGTVGHLESAPFLEAARQMQRELGSGNVLFFHLSHVPVVAPVNEQKTMPSQESTMVLRQAGIQPDVIIGRSEDPLSDSARHKILDRCNVEFVASSPNVKTVYEVPLLLREQGLDAFVLRKLNLEPRNCATCGGGMLEWARLVDRIKNPTQGTVRVALLGKYTGLEDAYISVEEALRHAGAAHDVGVEIKFLSAEALERPPSRGPPGAPGTVHEETPASLLSSFDAVIVPQGWGGRGAEGKIAAVRYVRESKTPFLGICYGFQMAVIEYARNVLGFEGANSTEVDAQTPHPVVCILPEQYDKDGLGGSARLGGRKILLTAESRVSKIYAGAGECVERFRHRYEANPAYVDRLSAAGLTFSGKHPESQIMQYLELESHPFFVATQAHPEYKSRLEVPSPPFVALIRAAMDHRAVRESRKA
jgi:CTP synthase